MDMEQELKIVKRFAIMQTKVNQNNQVVMKELCSLFEKQAMAIQYLINSVEGLIGAVEALNSKINDNENGPNFKGTWGI